MPLQKLQFKPGVDRENTRYAAEGQLVRDQQSAVQTGYASEDRWVGAPV